jgi:preprotein translocase subunit SecF
MEANGFGSCPPEHNTLLKTNKELLEKTRAMSQVLSEYMTQSASLNMKALLVTIYLYLYFRFIFL